MLDVFNPTQVMDFLSKQYDEGEEVAILRGHYSGFNGEVISQKWDDVRVKVAGEEIRCSSTDIVKLGKLGGLI